MVAGLLNSVKRLPRPKEENQPQLAGTPWYELRVRRPDWLRTVARVKPDHKAQSPSNDQSR